MASCTSLIFCSKMTLKIAADQSHKSASFIEIRELLVYLFFMTMLGMFTLGVYTQNSFHLNNALTNSFIQQPYYCGDERTNIFNVSSVDELWCYLEKRFIVTINAHPFWGNMGTKNETILLRQPRMRQVRVIEEDCLIPVANRGCFGQFSLEREDRSSFGLANGSAWVYNPPEDMGDIWFTGLISYYNSAGYYFTLTDASQLQFFKSHKWIDEQTRALFIDFTLYNININLFCVCQIMFELPPSGGITPSFLFSTVKLIRYNDSYDHMVLACEIVFAVFCFYYTAELIYEFVYFKQKVFTMTDNYIDSCIMALSWTSIGVLVYRHFETVPLLYSGGFKRMQELPDYQHLKNIHLLVERLTAVTLFCSFLKLYRFLHFDTIEKIYTTIQSCIRDMTSFCVLFFIILFAYAELGTLLFSNFVDSYRTLTASVFTLLRILLGEFRYQEITGVLSLIGPIYIVSFVMFVVFLLLNMFLAIINATYSDVSSNVKVMRKSEYLPFIQHSYFYVLTKIPYFSRSLPRSSEKVKKINNSDKISQLMKKSGFSELEIDAFFSRYTVDDNKEISDDHFQRVVHQNVGKEHLSKLKSRTNVINNSVEAVIRKKEIFLDRVGHLMRR